ncbi:hypothetical protein [Streptomyces sp. NPDC020489]|uniref:hypothetical protein n=1 Tax=Streptomyces sp. NPDC020489 TaxID=3365077 RepID=UPI0037B531AA
MNQPRTPRKATAKAAVGNKAEKKDEEAVPAVREGRRHWLPDPGTRRGAVFYAVAGPVVVAVVAATVEFVLRHVHIVIS